MLLLLLLHYLFEKFGLVLLELLNQIERRRVFAFEIAHDDFKLFNALDVF